MDELEGRKGDEVLAAARELGPILDSEAEKSEAQSALTQQTVDTLIRGGFFTMAAPRCFGGDELHPVSWMEVLEELARADGPSGWCMQAVSSYVAFLSSALPEHAASELHSGDWPPRVAGLTAPRGKAERVDGGYTLSGRFQFASGASFATHFVAGAIVYRDDEPVMADNGLPEMLMAVMPRDRVTELGNWDVNGMEATSSIDYEIEPMFVSNDFTVMYNPFPLKHPRGAPYWRTGVETLGPLGHSPVALGMARRALQEIAALAPKRKRPDGPYPAVGDQPLFQHDLALREAELDSVRLALHALVDRINDHVTENGGPVPLELMHRVKQTVRYLHDVAIRCVDFAYDWSGSAGLRKGHVIGRLFKNMHAIDQHVVVDRNTLIDPAPTVLANLGSGASDFATVKS